MDKGALVEFRLQGERLLAVITGPDGKKNWCLQTATGHIHRVHPRQVTFEWPEGPYKLQDIPQMESVSQEYISATDLEVAWEILVDTHEPTAPKDLAQLLFGEQTPVATYSAHRLLAEDRLYFKQKGEVYEARPREQVDEIRHQLTAAAEKTRIQEAFVQKIRRRLSAIPGSKDAEDLAWDREIDIPRLTALERWVLWQQESPDYRMAQETLRILGRREEPQDAFRLLVELGHWNAHENLFLLRSQIPQTFSERALAEAQKLLENPPLDQDQAARRDLRTLPVYTIDDESTQEVDDGLSVEQRPDGTQWIWVHVADPSRWIFPDSVLDREVRARGTSVYLPEKVLPMFPPELATGPMSLVAGRDNCGLSFAIQLSDTGEILNYEIMPTLLRTIYRIDYPEVDELLETGSEPTLEKLYQGAKKRRQYRLDLGAVQIDMPESQIKVQEESNKLSLEVLTESPSRLLVSEMMILVGEVTARYAQRENIPIPYRAQPQPQLPPKEEIDQLPLGPVRDYVLCRCMQRGETSISPASHGGLGLAAYAQATSPIRRYSDLVVHYQIKAHLRGEPLPFDAEQLRILLAPVESACYEATQLERQTVRYWLLEYIARESDTRQPALVLDWAGGDSHRGVVLLEQIGIRLPVRFDRAVSRGEMVDLKVVQIDPRQDLLVLKEVR
jgi:exoribonuclease II